MPCNQAWWRFHTGLQPTPARNLSHIPVVFLKFLSILVLLGLPSRSAERDNCPRPKKSSLRSSLFLFFTLDCNPIGSLFAKEGERNTHERKPRGGGWGGVGGRKWVQITACDWYSERFTLHTLQFIGVGSWAGVTYLRYRMLISPYKVESAVHCSDPALSVLVMFGDLWRVKTSFK